MGVSDNNSGNDLRGVIYRVLKTLRGSFLLSLVAFGIVLFAFAVLINTSISFTGQDGVIAAILGIFGISAVLFGIVGYLAFKVAHRL